MKYLIDFENNASQADIDAYLTAHSCQVLATFNLFEKVYHVDSPSQPPLDPIVTLVVHDELTTITPHLYTESSTSHINLTDEDQWWKTVSIENLDLNQTSVDIPRRGINSCVYVMDSGINSSHPEFIDASVTNLYSFNNDFTDYNGHGTALASVISGSTCGITSAKLVSVKIFQSGVPTYQSHILAALDAIANHVQANQNQFSVLNMSWAVPKNEYIESKIRQLIKLGIWAVCAAGNSGEQIENMTPAGMPETYTIGAFNRDLGVCDFSNLPSAIDNTQDVVNTGPVWFWSPGEHIRAAIQDSYDFVSGTSVAAAIASAAVAYNSWTFVKPDGSVPTQVLNAPLHPMMLSLNDYGGILNLPPEYQNTNNAIAKFEVYKLGEVLGINLPANSIKIKVEAGQHFDIQMISPVYTDEDVELLVDLPQGITRNYNFLEGQIDTTDYFTREIPYKVRYRNGFEQDFRVLLYVLAPDFTLEMIPEEDRILPLELLFGSCCANGGAPFYGCVSGFDCNICTNCGEKNFPDCINRCMGSECGSQSCP